MAGSQHSSAFKAWNERNTNKHIISPEAREVQQQAIDDLIPGDTIVSWIKANWQLCIIGVAAVAALILKD